VEDCHQQCTPRKILAPLLFNIFINGLDDGAYCTLSKFQEDANQSGVNNTPQGCAAIQRVLDRLEKLPEKKLIKFNKGKCKVLYLGRNNSMQKAGLGTHQLEISLAEKDFGALVDNELTINK